MALPADALVVGAPRPTWRAEEAALRVSEAANMVADDRKRSVDRSGRSPTVVSGITKVGIHWR